MSSQLQASIPNVKSSASDPVVLEREVRLGLVMYGGVSLAIYIYGVASEFFHAVRGDCPEYRALKMLIRSHIVVDVMSGASAGGVNAVLLGRALANPEADFDVCGELWREHGDFLALLQEPLTSDEGKVPAALFQSQKAYAEKLEQALTTIRNQRSRPTGKVLDSPITEFDVFLTATDIYGRIYGVEDSRGSPIDVKNHRAVFHLKHRQQRRGPTRKSAFNPDVVTRPGDRPLTERQIVSGLAAIARTTSAFPVAFHPVLYEPGSKELEHAVLMQKTLRDRANLVAAWFTDGGVLDNKPFTQAIDTIYHRSADRPVDRRLFYVEPDPERFVRRELKEPLPEQVALAAVTSIPGYESIADDLARLQDHNRRVRLFTRLASTVTGSQSQEIEPQDTQLYQRAQAAALAEWLEYRLVDASIDVWPELSRVLDFFGRRIVKLGRGYDLDRTLRKHFHAIYRLYETRLATNDLKRKRPCGAVLQLLFKEVDRLRIVAYVRDEMVDLLIDEAKGEAQREARKAMLLDGEESARASRIRLWRSLKRRLSSVPARLRVLLARVPSLGDDLDAFMDEIRPRAKPAPAGIGSLVEQIEQRTRQLLSAQGEQGAEALAFFEEFERVDWQLFPVQAAAGIESQDEIEHVRISPYDARCPAGFAPRWGLKPPDKISGDALFHFGGFIKRSWRSNDIFWGKCDGAEILIDSLFDQKRVQRTLESHPQLLEDVLKELSLSTEEKKSLTQCSPAASAVGLRDALIKSAHRRIAVGDVPKLAFDVRLEEEGEDPADRRAQRDRLVSDELAAAKQNGDWDEVERIAKRWVAPLGQEDLSDVSPLRIGRLVTQTGLLVSRIFRARTHALGIVGRIADRFLGVLETVLGALYLLARSMEINAKVNMLLVTGLGVGLGVSVLLVVFDALFGKAFPEGWQLAVVGMFAVLFTFAKHALSTKVEPRPIRSFWFGVSGLAPTLVSFLFTILIMLWMFRIDPGLEPIDKEALKCGMVHSDFCNGIIAFELGNDLAQANLLIDFWRLKMLDRFAWLCLLVDFPFIVAYCTLLVSLIFMVGMRLGYHVHRSFENVTFLLATLVVLAGVFDFLENAVLINMLWNAEADLFSVRIAYWAASAKFSVIAASMLFVVLGTLLYLGRRAASPRV